MRFLILVIVMGCLGLRAAPVDPYQGPKPVAVFIQTDPWSTLMGGDTPRVALYENRMLIYLHTKGKVSGYRHTTLSQKEFAAFKTRLLPVLKLEELKRSYNLSPNRSDQPKAVFYLQEGDREVATSVRGLMSGETRLPAFTVMPGKRMPDVVPDEVLRVHAFPCSIDYSGSKPWTPRFVEVVIWPYDDAPEESIIWPKKWPGLDSGRAIKDDDGYRIFMDGDSTKALAKFLRRQKESGAVLIGGKKWAVDYRYVFPSEPIWAAALEKRSQK